MKKITDTSKQTIFFAIRVGALVGMFGFYIPLLGGYIPIDNLTITILKFILSSVSMALFSGFLIYLIVLIKTK